MPVQFELLQCCHKFNKNDFFFFIGPLAEHVPFNYAVRHEFSTYCSVFAEYRRIENQYGTFKMT